MLNNYSQSLKNKLVCAEELKRFCQQQSNVDEEFIPSNIPSLDEYLQGGLPQYGLTECGMPLGQGGRMLLLKFVAVLTAQQHKWVLWIVREKPCHLYPPAFAAQGVDLQYVRFVTSESPIAELKLLFLEQFFDMIIFDHPGRLRSEDCAFLSRQARQLGQATVVVRNYLLGRKPSAAHVWATLRFNCYFDHYSQAYQLATCRGLKRPSLCLPKVSL